MVTCLAPLSLWLMGFGKVISLLFAGSIFTIALAIFVAPVAALTMEAFPVAYRFTGMGLAWNGAAVVFGGTVGASLHSLISCCAGATGRHIHLGELA